MEATHNRHGIPSPSLLGDMEEQRMIERGHGIDRHERFSPISVMDCGGEDVLFIAACKDRGKYVDELGSGDAVV